MWQRVTREQLYEQVWSVPIWKLCGQYGLSDNGLRKICRRLNVPVPPRGYWAKVEAGHKVRKAALPPDAKTTVAEVRHEPKPERTAADDEDAVWLREREAFEADPANRVEVVEKPRRWHPAVAPLKEGLDAETKEIEVSRKAQERYDRSTDWEKQRDWASARMAWFSYERAGQLMPVTHRASVVRLSIAEYRRGLAILNAVAMAAVKRGFAATFDQSKGRIVLEGHDARLEVRMAERTVATTRTVKRYDGKMEEEQILVPTGRLRLYVERSYGNVWTCEERAEERLESRLNRFFAGVWKQVTYCHRATRKAAAQAQRWAALAAERAEIERRKAEEEARREEERERREALVAEVAAWRQANEIRAYVASVRAEMEKIGGEVNEEFIQWEDWALNVAKESDPVTARFRAALQGA